MLWNLPNPSDATVFISIVSVFHNRQVLLFVIVREINLVRKGSFAVRHYLNSLDIRSDSLFSNSFSSSKMTALGASGVYL